MRTFASIRPCLIRAICFAALQASVCRAAAPIQPEVQRPVPSTPAQGPADPAQAAPSRTSKVVAAANAFLATLDEKQRASVSFAFDDEAQRARWSNLPLSMSRRSGLSMGELSEPQRSAVMALLESALSAKGFQRVRQIMAGDEVLNQTQRKTSMFGKDLYCISFLGKPSEKDPWMVQFGGHHLALNLTIVGERGVLTPSLIGTQPSLYETGGKTIRPLGPESDKAFALLKALDDGQRKLAILNYRVADLVLGPGQDAKRIQPEGLKASGMSQQQRDMLLDLISEWANIAQESYAAPRMAEIKAGLDETWFAWSGPTTVEAGKNGDAYYRIQGPKVVIEYAPQHSGGPPSLHVHTMYRDPTNDYARGLIGK